MNNTFQMLISQLSSAGPLMLVWLGGAVFALVYWQRCPTPSLLVLLACALFIILQVLGIALAAFVYPNLHGKEAGIIISGIGFVRTVAYILGDVMILAAVFIGRPPAPLPTQFGKPPTM
jgi:hypothetical protein